MAKKKQPIEEIKAKEVMVESVEEKAEVAEQVDEAFDEAVERHIRRKLMAINNMTDRAKAKRLAERVLRNRKG